MFRSLRSILHRVLRVPSEPAPFAPGAPVRMFRAAPNYYRYKLVVWVIAQLGALVGLLLGAFFFVRLVDRFPLGSSFVGAFETLAWIFFFLQLPFSYAMLRLDFELRWYLLSDRSLRIREGLLLLHEKTMTFANVQQISIRQNPLQRLLGISDVVVRTAGGGATEKGGEHVGEALHEAWFRGVGNAGEIRAAIHDRVRKHRDTGLGDPDDAALAGPVLAGPDSPQGAHSATAAARELREEVRLLRAAVATGRDTPRPSADRG